MSDALTTSELRTLEAVVRPYALLSDASSERVVELVSLVARLKALRHCDQCGVLFDGRATADECHHCQSDRREYEAIEARGGHL